MPSRITPVFSLSICLSKSDLFFAVLMYSRTSSLFSILSHIFSTRGCSGAKTINVTPNIVSGLVVKTSTSSPPIPNFIFAPSLFPIQFLWAALIDSGKSTLSNPSNSFSAYSGILRTHCFNIFFTTGFSPLSEILFPSLSVRTSSSAKTVFRSSHHQIGVSLYSAKLF